MNDKENTGRIPKSFRFDRSIVERASKIADRENRSFTNYLEKLMLDDIRKKSKQQTEPAI